MLAKRSSIYGKGDLLAGKEGEITLGGRGAMRSKLGTMEGLEFPCVGQNLT